MRYFLLLLLFFTNSLWAGIEYVNYHPNETPRIKTAAGIITEIVFERGEKIIFNSTGYSAAWEVKLHPELPNILFLLPKKTAQQTNLLVHTNKRKYVFLLTSGKNNWKYDPNNSNATYSFRIKYYDSLSNTNLVKKEKQRKAKQARKEEKARKREEKQQQANTIAHHKPHIKTERLYFNYDYRTTKKTYDRRLVPLDVWDNGINTFIKLTPGESFPSIYSANEGTKKESLLNFNVEIDGVVNVHGVHKYLVLRLEDKVVELRRNNVGAVENKKKTTVKGKKRKVKENHSKR